MRRTAFAYAAATREAREAREAESSIAGAYAELTPSEQQALNAQAEALLRSGGGCAAPSSSSAVCLVHGVLSPDECAEVVVALRAKAKRSGWGSRHNQHATADMGIGVLPTELEALLRSRLFSQVLQPLAECYFERPMLPEALRFNDLFFVRYSAAEGEQNELASHTDGSIFSFNLLLTPPSAFEGGGTFFEVNGTRSAPVSPPVQGGAVVHSGRVRHGGAPITSGERILLVGFVDVEPTPYTAQLARWAAVAAFGKFGQAAWQRPSLEHRIEVAHAVGPLVTFSAQAIEAKCWASSSDSTGLKVS